MFMKRALPLMAVVTMGLAASTAYGEPTSAKQDASVLEANNSFWWPNRLDLTPLRLNNQNLSPLGADYDYTKAFKDLDVAALKKDLRELMTTSQDWWPADYGHYGPFFIRMSWHAAGTYRLVDGRGGADGGQQRFAPLNSWPDNVNLDKARRLLWPIKEKYGNKISWADLITYAGTLAMEDMGFKTAGFAFGRTDDWSPEEVNWGPEGEWLGSSAKRFMTPGKDKLKGPLAATHMGLIYVNPEGPGANHKPLAAAERIREAFGKMAMNDEETVALIAGGHTFGKAHGAGKASNLGKEPEAAGVEEQGLGWKNKYKSGKGADTITSGLEGAWTVNPKQWTHNYLDNLFRFEWKQVKTPAGATQWIPTDENAAEMVPDAHDPDKFHAPIMFTTDLALKEDPAYRKIAKRFHDNPEEFEKAFANAWFKLTHRDMGPVERYMGPDLPEQTFVWQDPTPEADYDMISSRDEDKLKKAILKTDLTVGELVRTAWAAAASFRNTDLRGGTVGGRLRLEPQVSWDVNNPTELRKVLKALEKIQKDFNDKNGDTKVSMADLIVLAGNAAIEKAADEAGHDVEVPFTAGRTDATQAMTDVAGMKYLEPKADGFRNYFSKDADRSPAEMLIERAALLDLNVPEMTVLVGGLRVLGANYKGSKNGVFTDEPGELTNDFFENLIDLDTQWKKSDKEDGLYVGYSLEDNKEMWTATPVDLVFGSNSELRAVAEVYAQDDAEDKFVKDFVAAWTKVMNNGRF